MNNSTKIEKNEEKLLREVCYFHYLIFNREAPLVLVEAYISAHSNINDLVNCDKEQLVTIQKIIDYQLDALGIEPWLRFNSKKRHILSSKLLLIAYISECDSLHNEFIHQINTKNSIIKKIILLCLRSTARKFIGIIQIIKYGLF